MKPTLLVLAAGMGSRYGGLKQIDALGPHGETIIDYSIHDAIRAGFGKVVFVIRPDFEARFRETLGQRFERQIETAYAFQELSRLPAGWSIPPGREKPWGTGHAVLMAQDIIHEPFAIINADDFYGRESFALMARHLEQARDTDQADFAMVGYTLSRTLSEHGTVSRGVCVLTTDGLLRTVVEHTHIRKTPDGGIDETTGTCFSGNETVSMNFFGFTPSIFPHLRAQFETFLTRAGSELKREFYIPAVVDTLVRESQATVKVLRTESPWFGITYREDRPFVQAGIQELIARGEYATLRVE